MKDCKYYSQMIIIDSALNGLSPFSSPCPEKGHHESELFSCNLCNHCKPVRAVVDDVSSLVFPI